MEGNMNKFSDYIKGSTSHSQDNLSQNNNVKLNNTTQYSSDKLEDMINMYSSMDNNSLMHEFIKLTLEKKRKGELSKKEIESLKSTLMPYLSAEQQNNLKKILDVVDNV